MGVVLLFFVQKSKKKRILAKIHYLCSADGFNPRSVFFYLKI